ncbi:MAG TPA: hypothetical protein VGL65_00775 [Gemmatimonadales bacterium]|jgi:hypothetical protein
MFRIPPVLLASVLVTSAVAACSRSAASSRSTGTAATATATTAAVHGSACSQQLLTVADVGGILSAPITGTEEVPGTNGSTCKFTTGSFTSISVTLRPGAGKVSLGIWQGGHMPTASAPLAGVGDEAVWVPSLNEVVSEKNDLLCDIMAQGVARDLAGPVAVVQQKVGALCNKIFAAVK